MSKLKPCKIDLQYVYYKNVQHKGTFTYCSYSLSYYYSSIYIYLVFLIFAHNNNIHICHKILDLLSTTNVICKKEFKKKDSIYIILRHYTYNSVACTL